VGPDTSVIVKLVPIGGFYDWDKNGEESLTAILLSCYDTDACTLQGVCKIFCTEQMKDAIETLMDYSRPNKCSMYEVTNEQEADIWFDPVSVWEIKIKLNSLYQSSDVAAASKKMGGNSGIGVDSNSRGFQFIQISESFPEEALTSDTLMKHFQERQTGGRRRT